MYLYIICVLSPAFFFFLFCFAANKCRWTAGQTFFYIVYYYDVYRRAHGLWNKININNNNITTTKRRLAVHIARYMCVCIYIYRFAQWLYTYILCTWYTTIYRLPRLMCYIYTEQLPVPPATLPHGNNDRISISTRIDRNDQPII